MNTRHQKYIFIGISFLSLFGLGIMTILINKHSYMFILLLVIMLFEIVQLMRIFKMGMIYKKWINHEILYTTFIFALLLSVPNLLRFSFSMRFWKYFAIFSLIFMVIIISVLIIKIITYRNSFFTSDKGSLSDVINKVEKKGIEYEIKQSDCKYDFFCKRKEKEIHLSKYECKIFKTNQGLIIKPNNKKSQKNVFSIINIMELEIK